MNEKTTDYGKTFDVGQIVKTPKFKNASALVQMSLLIIFAVVGAGASVGWQDFRLDDWAVWANSFFLFLEQTYAYNTAYNWFFDAISRSDAVLAGKYYPPKDPTPEDEREIGLVAELQGALIALKAQPKDFDDALAAWNKLDKLEIHRAKYEKPMTKALAKLTKAKSRRKRKDRSIARFERQVADLNAAINDKSIEDTIEYMKVPGYVPLLHKDLVNVEMETKSKSKSRNTLVSLGAYKAALLSKKFVSWIAGAAFGGHIIYTLAFGANSAGQIALMLFLIAMQVGSGASAAYKAIQQVLIPNYQLRLRAALFCSEWISNRKAKIEAEAKAKAEADAKAKAKADADEKAAKEKAAIEQAKIDKEREITLRAEADARIKYSIPQPVPQPQPQAVQPGSQPAPQVIVQVPPQAPGSPVLAGAH